MKYANFAVKLTELLLCYKQEKKNYNKTVHNRHRERLGAEMHPTQATTACAANKNERAVLYKAHRGTGDEKHDVLKQAAAAAADDE